MCRYLILFGFDKNAITRESIRVAKSIKSMDQSPDLLAVKRPDIFRSDREKRKSSSGLSCKIKIRAVRASTMR